jgi:hypothetical protein
MTQDPFAIPIAIFRNTGYVMPLTLEDFEGEPFPTPEWAFRLEISPSSFDRSWTEPSSFSQQNVTSGSGATGTTFILHEEDTAALDYRLSYRWRVLALAPGADPSSLIGGSCTVYDGPAMPQVEPGVSLN